VPYGRREEIIFPGLAEAAGALKMDEKIDYSMNIITANAVWLEERGTGGFPHPPAEAGAGAGIPGSLAPAGFTARGSGV
jgi:hypothetical protein